MMKRLPPLNGVARTRWTIVEVNPRPLLPEVGTSLWSSTPNASMAVTTADGAFTEVDVSDQDIGTGVVAP